MSNTTINRNAPVYTANLSSNPGTTSTSGAPSTAGVDSFGGTGGAGYTSFEGTSSVVVPQMPSAKGLDLRDPNVMAKYQEDMQYYTQMLSLKSQIQTMLHDTRKQMVSNMRA
jgi:hypothetical protein